MVDKDNSGPAFPVEAGIINKGMTLRDYFAAKAMQGIYSNPQRKGTCIDAASGAYEVADAMLEARKS